MARNSGFKDGQGVRLTGRRGIPQRYQGRSGVVVGNTTGVRGARQILVAFPGRRVTPLPVNFRNLTAI